jgi:hypothetical protein
MKRIGIAAALCGLALLTFFQFPGHTWLQEDSQIYAPILEHLRDPAVLRNDLLVERPHVAYTVYDEIAVTVSRATGLTFRDILFAQQIAARALGMWGVWLLAIALGLGEWPAFTVATIASLGAVIAGPSVLTLEYEPTPRAFAVPLLFLGIGLLAHRGYLSSACAAAAAFVYHPLTAAPFWAIFAAVVLVRRRYRALLPLGFALLLLLVAAKLQSGAGTAWFGRLSATDEEIQRIRAAYVWVSTWPADLILHHVLVFAIFLAAFLRIARKAPLEIRSPLVGLALLGLLAMPISWVLLERWHWALIPQVQPLRLLLFGTFGMVVAASVAGVQAALRGNLWEAAVWFLPAYAIPTFTTLLGPFAWKPAAVVLALAAATALARRYAAVTALAAFVAIPVLGGVVNYPDLHSPELAALSSWARATTPLDAVFLFPDSYRSRAPGIFRAEALRAVYVDSKGGGQVNYLKGFAEIWWPRWQQTMPRKFNRALLSSLPAGIDYIVLQPGNRLPAEPLFQNDAYLVYAAPSR